MYSLGGVPVPASEGIATGLTHCHVGAPIVNESHETPLASLGRGA